MLAQHITDITSGVNHGTFLHIAHEEVSRNFKNKKFFNTLIMCRALSATHHCTSASVPLLSAQKAISEMISDVDSKSSRLVT